MSFVVAAAEYLEAAASDLANIGSTITAANAAAVFPTSAVLPAGADEVSALIAALFGSHAKAYQALSAQAASFHQQFVQLMNGGAAAYVSTEAANAEQAMLNAVNAPTQGLFGRALIGNGANGASRPARRRRRNPDRQRRQRRGRHRPMAGGRGGDAGPVG